MANGELPYNYERCFNNSKSIEMLEKQIGEHRMTLQQHEDSLKYIEKDRNERKIQNRWMIGLLVTILGVAISVAVRIWS